MDMMIASVSLISTAFVRLIPFGIANIIYAIINFYVLIIIAWAVLSWFRGRKGLVRDIYQVLDKIVDPYVGLFRKFIPVAGGLDFSPLIAIVILQVIIRVLTSL